MKRILFVDDEQQILDGMRNMLRKNRHVWEMVFVSSGEAALAEMAERPFDVIISDMRMPRMDGAALLAIVRERFPRTARFVLSGQADHEAVYRALQYTQQFLSKPCDPQELLNVVQRTCAFQDIVAHEDVRQAVGKLGQLPSASTLYLQLCEALDDPETPSQRIAEIVGQDPAMVAKLLQLVNSAFFGLAKKTSSISQAIQFLGIDLIKSLTLSLKVFSHFDDPSIRDLVNSVQSHSLATARLATSFVSDRTHWELLFTTSLLHDIGILALVQSQPETYWEILDAAKASQRPLHEVEAKLGYVQHAAVGGYLLGVWGLPFEIAEVVTYHHQLPNADPQPQPGQVNHRVLLAVHVADSILESQATGVALEEFLDHKSIEAMGATSCVRDWIASASTPRSQMANVQH